MPTANIKQLCFSKFKNLCFVISFHIILFTYKIPKWLYKNDLLEQGFCLFVYYFNTINVAFAFLVLSLGHPFTTFSDLTRNKDPLH